MCLNSDVFLQLCGPSLEYPDSTRNTKIKFSGILPPKPLNPDLVYPEWWADVTGAAAGGKKVVFLAQGTVEDSLEALILPAIRALAGGSDIVLVAVIGARGGSLPADFQIPKHTRVIDYFPYDPVLQYADVFVFNAGYGGTSHAIGNGIPMVALSALGQDKPENAARIEWSGHGLAIRSPNPETSEIKTAVRKVLDDGKFKDKALAVQRESHDLNPLAKIEDQIRAFTI